MQTLLNEIELDVQELKCLMQVLATDAKPEMKVIIKRSIQQMTQRLDALQNLLDEDPPTVVTVDEPVTLPSSTSPILAERIKPAADLRHAISLNDSFRFAREIFGGDTARMNEVIRQLGAASSLDHALELFFSTVHPDEENETVVDFVELLKKYFS